jgi:hypothetical protein
LFDLRYHVASLAAVFIALVIGIVVGVGLSESGVAKQAELENARRDLAAERAANAQLDSQLGEYSRTQNAFRDAYPFLMDRRLSGKKIAVLFAGPIDGGVRDAIERTLLDAGAATSGIPLRLISLKLPIDDADLATTLDAAGSEFSPYAGKDRLGALGRALAREFVQGGEETPLWQLLSPKLVEQRSGALTQPADGVVVVRTAPPQAGPTARLLSGLVSGIAAQGAPAVAVEETDAEESAVPIFRQRGLSTVDDIDLGTGRFALALLLADAASGAYGVRDDADGVLPPVEPLPAEQ